MFESVMIHFINPVFLYGLHYVLVAVGILLVVALGLFFTKRMMLGVLCLVLLALVAGSVPLYRDTVMRARDAERSVIKLWAAAYPGTFALTAEGDPGLPPYPRAVLARVKAALPGGADLFGWADDCMRRMEGRDGNKRRYDAHILSEAATAPACRDSAALKATYNIYCRDVLAEEYAALRQYAMRVAALDRDAQLSCPPFFTMRGKEQAQYLDKISGLMKPEHDLSGHRCACVALGRHQGCQAVTERDKQEGYVAEFAKYDFYTPLTCDQSEACTTLRMVGIDPGLDNAAPDIPAAEKTARIQATTEKCITVGQFMPERRAELCACTNALLVGQDPRVTRLSPAAAECLEDRGGLDDDHCVIGEADWNAASRAAFICSAGG